MTRWPMPMLVLAATNPARALELQSRPDDPQHPARGCTAHLFEGSGLQRFVNGNMFPDSATERLINRADNAGGLRNTGELSNALVSGGILGYRFHQANRLTMPVLVIAEPARDLY